MRWKPVVVQSERSAGKGIWSGVGKAGAILVASEDLVGEGGELMDLPLGEQGEQVLVEVE